MLSWLQENCIYNRVSVLFMMVLNRIILSYLFTGNGLTVLMISVLWCARKEKKKLHTQHILLVIWHLTYGRKEMFYLTTHSAHFIYGYMVSEQTYSSSVVERPLMERWVIRSIPHGGPTELFSFQPVLQNWCMCYPVCI